MGDRLEGASMASGMTQRVTQARKFMNELLNCDA